MAEKTLEDALNNSAIEVIAKTDDDEETLADDAPGVSQESLVRATKQVSDSLKQAEEESHDQNTLPQNVVILSDDRKVHEQAQMRGIRTIRSDDVRLGLPSRSPSSSPSTSGSEGSGVLL
jgi:hypothetical protein